MAKVYTIRERYYRRETCREKDWTGTIEELTQIFSYTLLKGKSWEHERGNKRINMTPKTAASLVTNLNNAESNAAANGCANTYYCLV